VAEADSNKAEILGGWATPQMIARRRNYPAPDELNYYLRPLNMDVIREGEPVPERGAPSANP
jgi:hypothetical protein